MTSWDDIENPAYTAGKNYEEPPQHTCVECVYFEPHASSALGLCALRFVGSGELVFESMEALEELLEWRNESDYACALGKPRGSA